MAAMSIHLLLFIHTSIRLLRVPEIPHLLPPPNTTTSIQTPQPSLPDTGYQERLLHCGFSTCLLYFLNPSRTQHLYLLIPHIPLVQSYA